MHFFGRNFFQSLYLRIGNFLLTYFNLKINVAFLHIPNIYYRAYYLNRQQLQVHLRKISTWKLQLAHFWKSPFCNIILVDCCRTFNLQRQGLHQDNMQSRRMVRIRNKRPFYGIGLLQFLPNSVWVCVSALNLNWATRHSDSKCQISFVNSKMVKLQKQKFFWF